jgi:hypothetical protein
MVLLAFWSCHSFQEGASGDDGGLHFTALREEHPNEEAAAGERKASF